MCTSLRRAVRAVSRDDPRTGEAMPVELVTVQLGSGSMAMKSQAAHDAAGALREISPLDPGRGARGRGGKGGGELLPEAEARLRLALRAPLPRSKGGASSSSALSPPAPSPGSAAAPAAAPLTIPPWFLIETKIDGYRLQLHKDTTPGGFKEGVRFFSPRCAPVFALFFVSKVVGGKKTNSLFYFVFKR